MVIESSWFDTLRTQFFLTLLQFWGIPYFKQFKPQSNYKKKNTWIALFIYTNRKEVGKIYKIWSSLVIYINFSHAHDFEPTPTQCNIQEILIVLKQFSSSISYTSN